MHDNKLCIYFLFCCWLQSVIFHLSQLYIGGVIEQNLPHLPTTPNFRGCLENVFINGINIIDMAKREEPEIRIPLKVVDYISVIFLHFK